MKTDCIQYIVYSLVDILVLKLTTKDEHNKFVRAIKPSTETSGSTDQNIDAQKLHVSCDLWDVGNLLSGASDTNCLIKIIKRG